MWDIFNMVMFTEKYVRTPGRELVEKLSYVQKLQHKYGNYNTLSMRYHHLLDI